VDVVDRHVLGMFFVGLPDTTVRLSDRFSATVIRGWTVDLVDHLNGYRLGIRQMGVIGHGIEKLSKR